MRAIILAMLVAAGISLIGTMPASAAPAQGSVILDAAAASSPIEQVRRKRYRRHGPACYTKCYYEFIIGPRVCRTFCPRW
jgi:hypothetical protein